MKFASLGSGSEGNALLVSAGGTRVLMDCGFGLNETLSRLARLGVEPSDLSGILVTHEHGDHARGVVRLARKFGLTVWLTHGTWRNLQESGIRVQEISPHDVFAIGDLEVIPYPVPHDAAEPVQFVFGDGQHRLGVLTDAGCATPHIESTLDGCDALVLECNHDREMLQNGHYPASLKQRVGGRLGHLSNEQAAGILARLETGRLQHLLAAHLSAQNNQPSLAVNALSAVMGCAPDWIGVATQAGGFDWREIS
ncbi:MAG: MBL fold metallo-hydrolase [Gallionella sp.]|jgi:phosphoribosyl 1,2-cyclic phosphodiesterase|nr:MBL fold metallo-hydrolase [Gallionella sp.]